MGSVECKSPAKGAGPCKSPSAGRKETPYECPDPDCTPDCYQEPADPAEDRNRSLVRSEGVGCATTDSLQGHRTRNFKRGSSSNGAHSPGFRSCPCRPALLTCADFPQMIERVNARVMPVVPVDSHRVAPYLFHRIHLQLWLVHLERAGRSIARSLRLRAMRAGTRCAGTLVAQVFE